MGYKRPYHIGPLMVASNIFCSPLAGCSDLPFRNMTTKYKPGLVFCEMVKMDALIRHDPNTYRILDYESHMHPIGAQLCGSKPEIAGACAKILEDLGFDVIDLNCGCPVDKVTKDESGSGLLKNPKKIGDILCNMIAAVKVPVTVKVRAGWDSESINAPLITQIAEQAGAKIIFVHGRTRAQGYNGPANWDYIRDCKQAAKTIQVFGNGDIVDVASAQRMFEHTGCDGLLLARGTFGKPWLIEDIVRHFEGEEVRERTLEDQREALLEHLDHIISYQEERKALLDLRRIGAWYLKNGDGIKQLREVIVTSADLKEAQRQIQEYFACMN